MDELQQRIAQLEQEKDALGIKINAIVELRDYLNTQIDTLNKDYQSYGERINALLRKALQERKP